MSISFAGVTNAIGGCFGYECGTHIDMGMLYVAPRKSTDNVPKRWTSSSGLPFSCATRYQKLLVVVPRRRTVDTCPRRERGEVCECICNVAVGSLRILILLQARAKSATFVGSDGLAG